MTEYERGLRDAWNIVWIQRFDRERGKVGGPDSYYAGCVSAATDIMTRIRELEAE